MAIGIYIRYAKFVYLYVVMFIFVDQLNTKLKYLKFYYYILNLPHVVPILFLYLMLPAFSLRMPDKQITILFDITLTSFTSRFSNKLDPKCVTV